MMEKAAANVTDRMKQPEKLRNISPDLIIEPILNATAPLGLSEADKETVRAGLKVLFSKPDVNDFSEK